MRDESGEMRDASGKIRDEDRWREEMRVERSEWRGER